MNRCASCREPCTDQRAFCRPCHDRNRLRAHPVTFPGVPTLPDSVVAAINSEKAPDPPDEVLRWVTDRIYQVIGPALREQSQRSPKWRGDVVPPVEIPIWDGE